jgi:hypothetical protein
MHVQVSFSYANEYRQLFVNCHDEIVQNLMHHTNRYRFVKIHHQHRRRLVQILDIIKMFIRRLIRRRPFDTCIVTSRLLFYLFGANNSLCTRVYPSVPMIVFCLIIQLLTLPRAYLLIYTYIANAFDR